MIHLGIVDAGEARLRSTELVLRRVAAQLRTQCAVHLVREPERLRQCDRLVLAAQGTFPTLCSALSPGLAEAIRESVAAGTPFLAISLGMQALFDSVQGACTMPGLGIFPGTSRPLTPAIDPLAGTHTPVPHVGWNRLMLERTSCPVLSTVGRHGPWVYFSHSFHALPDDRGLVTASAECGPQTIVAAISKDNVVATQFRPDRSHRTGVRVLVAFLEQSG